MAKRQKTLNWKSISKKGKNFEILLIDCMAQAFIKIRKGKKIFGVFYASAYRQYEADRWFIEKEVDLFIKEARRKEAKEPGSILQSYGPYEKMLKELIQFSQTLSEIDFSKYSTIKLVNILNKYFWLGGKPIVYGYNYYFYQYLGDDLYTILNKKVEDRERREKLFEIFTQAKYFSYMQQSQTDLLEFVAEIRRKKIKITSVVAQKWFDKYLSKFAFMGMYFFRGTPWQRDDLVKRIKYWQKEDYREELTKFKLFEKESNRWKKHAKEINLSKKEKILVETIKQMTYCTNLYDEAWSQLTYNGRLLLHETAHRLDVRRDELIQMTTKEIISILSSGKVVPTKLRKSIQERVQDSCYLMVGNTIEVISGQQLNVYRGREKKKIVSNKQSNILQGQTASPGVAVVRVTKLTEVAELARVKKGDILVAKCTVPAFLPAMERASAFVTETGGLLSHAAIVAREIGKPCVIGVENVMRILKDGDRVEVDATKGVVRKI